VAIIKRTKAAELPNEINRPNYHKQISPINCHEVFP